MSRTVSIAAPVTAAIEAHAKRERPHECCGLLLGTTSAIVDLIPTRNISERPAARYAIGPVEHLAAMRVARARGLAIVGAYHSHVASPPVPSETDRAEAFAGFLFLILSLAEPSSPALKAWELESGNFVPVSLVRTT